MRLEDFKNVDYVSAQFVKELMTRKCNEYTDCRSCPFNYHNTSNRNFCGNKDIYFPEFIKLQRENYHKEFKSITKKNIEFARDIVKKGGCPKLKEKCVQCPFSRINQSERISFSICNPDHPAFIEYVQEFIDMFEGITVDNESDDDI